MAAFDRDGAHRWSTNLGPEVSGSLVIDRADNMYLAGGFGGTLTLGDHVLVSAGNNDAYLAKMSPAPQATESAR